MKSSCGVANFVAHLPPKAVELDLSEWRGRQPVRNCSGRSAFPPIGELPYLLTLQGYSFYWFELLPTAAEAGRPASSAHQKFLTLVMPHGWPDLFSSAQSAAARG